MHQNYLESLLEQIGGLYPEFLTLVGLRRALKFVFLTNPQVMMLGWGSDFGTHCSKILQPVDLLLLSCRSSLGTPVIWTGDLLHLSSISVMLSPVLSVSSSLRWVFSCPSSVSLPGIPAMALLLFATTHVMIFCNCSFCFISFLNSAISLFTYFYCFILPSSLELFFFWSEFFVWLLFIAFLFLLFCPEVSLQKWCDGFFEEFCFFAWRAFSLDPPLVEYSGGKGAWKTV